MPSRTIEESHRPRVSDRTMHCHSRSGQSSGLLFQKTTGAVTTAKWNHRKEELILRFICGGEPKPSVWARPLSEEEYTFKQLGSMPRQKRTGIEPRGRFFS
jgi:hypothetical protein